MNCRDISHSSVPRIPRGNDFKLAVVLKEYVKADGGQVSERDIDIASLTTVAVVRANGDSVVPTYTRNGTAIVIDFPQQESAADGLGKGKYGVEITGKRTDGSDFRFFLPLAFYIVESTPEGYFPADSIITYTVNGVVGVAQNVGGSGADVTIGTLDTTATEAQTPSVGESFGGYITLHRVAKTGSWNDLRDKPTIPAAQQQADWEETDTTAKAFIKNKPDIPSVPSWALQPTKPAYTASEVGALPSSTTIPTKTSELTNDSGFLTAHQDISGKEDRLAIATTIGTTAEMGRYYRLTTATALTVNMPEVSPSATRLEGFIVCLTIATGGSVTFVPHNAETILQSGLDDIAEGKTYEINAVWNGAMWAITATELTTLNAS